MSISTFNQSGNTTNQWCARGTGQVAAPMIGNKSVIPVVYATNAFTVAVADSGCVYTVPANGANATINLPAPASTPSGTNYKFIFNIPATHTTVFTSATAGTIFGTALTPLDATKGVAYAGTTTATAPAGTLVGDSADFTSDTVNWYMLAQSQANALWT